MFGDMVFEILDHLIKNNLNSERIEKTKNCLHILQIPIKQTIEELEQICYETVERNKSVFHL